MNATRTALLGIRARMRDAVWGCEILKEKRNSLVRELMKIVPELLRNTEALEASMSRSYQSLTQMLALDGPEVSGSCAVAASGEIFVGMESTSVMGVPIPKIEIPDSIRAPDARGYHLLGTSTRVDLTARDFEVVLHQLMKLASKEISLRRVGEEIRKTNRRVNGLEQIVIPRLKQQGKYIQMVLNEREREDTYRLRRIKQVLRKKDGASHGRR
jgi:V/A-type H+-transporting ATPase subunit D